MGYPIFGRAQPQPALQVERPKARSPELNSKWAKFAKSFLRKNPFCCECALHGRDIPAALVDHIIPRSEGGSLWDANNLQALCAFHHNGVKRELERAAASTGDIRVIIRWIKDPATRPGRLAFRPCDWGDV